MMELVSQQEYQALVNQISDTYELGRQRAAEAVDKLLVQTYWEIGQYIVEFEQRGYCAEHIKQVALQSIGETLRS